MEWFKIKANSDEKKLNKMIEKAADREQNDDHLNDEERKVIVDLYKKLNPKESLPGDLHDAYISIIF